MSTVAFLYVASRFLLALTFNELYDLHEVVDCGSMILGGPSRWPTLLSTEDCAKYPPAFHYWSAFLVLVTGGDPLALRLLHVPLEVTTMLGIVVLSATVTPPGDDARGGARVRGLASGRTSGSSRQRSLPVFFFAFSPISSFIFVATPFELVTPALLTWALVAHCRDHWAACGALLTLGSAFEVYPAFVLAFLFVELLATGRRSSILKFAAGALATAAAIQLPFIIVLGGGGVLQGFAIHFSRPPRAYSLWQQFRDWGLWLEADLVTPLGVVPVSLVGVVVVVFGAFTVLGAAKRGKAARYVSKRESVTACVVVLLLMQVVFLSIFHRYLLWALAPACALLEPVETRPREFLAASPLVVLPVLIPNVFVVLLTSLVAWVVLGGRARLSSLEEHRFTLVRALTVVAAFATVQVVVRHLNFQALVWLLPLTFTVGVVPTVVVVWRLVTLEL
ncbi:MAG: hypothetical protein Kow0069_37760 [Promethearchaeota archaeon]